jgi:type IV pilus assembly protein PilE
MPFRRRTQGFTLIEVMITVAIVAILAAIAYPAYQDQIRKSRRNAAQAALLEVAQKEMQLFVDTRNYRSETSATAMAGPPLRVNIAENLSSAYTFSVVADNVAAPPTFVVTAAPQGAQAADKCGTMTISQIGAKTSALTSGCW